MPGITLTWRRVCIIIFISKLAIGLSRIYQQLHLLSLDIVLGAVGGYAFACKVLNQEISFSVSIILAIAVWITYITDHLLDIRSAVNQSRYAFLSKNLRFFLILLTLLCLAEVILIFLFLSVKLIIHGLLIGIGLVIYLFLQHAIKGGLRKFFPKEILISCIYILAVWFEPLSRAEKVNAVQLYFMAIHFMLVLSNVLMFSFFEREEDLLKLKASVFSHFRLKTFRKMVLLVILVTLAAGISTIFLYLEPLSGFSTDRAKILPSVVLILILLLYLLEIRHYQNPIFARYYRQITDGAFLLFLLFSLVSG